MIQNSSSLKKMSRQIIISAFLRALVSIKRKTSFFSIRNRPPFHTYSLHRFLANHLSYENQRHVDIVVHDLSHFPVHPSCSRSYTREALGHISTSSLSLLLYRWLFRLDGRTNAASILPSICSILLPRFETSETQTGTVPSATGMFKSNGTTSDPCWKWLGKKHSPFDSIERSDYQLAESHFCLFFSNT